MLAYIRLFRYYRRYTYFVKLKSRKTSFLRPTLAGKANMEHGHRWSYIVASCPSGHKSTGLHIPGHHYLLCSNVTLTVSHYHSTHICMITFWAETVTAGLEMDVLAEHIYYYANHPGNTGPIPWSSSGLVWVLHFPIVRCGIETGVSHLPQNTSTGGESNEFSTFSPLMGKAIMRTC